jgi:hypothetical protein
VIVARDLLIAEDTGKPWHIAHVSTATSARSRALGARARRARHLRGDAAPSAALDDRFDTYRADAKVNPPLRGRARRARCCAAVRDGTIDAFATDHAPHGLDEKAQLLSDAPVGFSGLEIAIGAYAARAARLAARAASSSCSVDESGAHPRRSRRHAAIGAPGRRHGLRRPPVDASMRALSTRWARIRRSTARRSRAAPSQRSSAAPSSTSTDACVPRDEAVPIVNPGRPMTKRAVLLLADGTRFDGEGLGKPTRDGARRGGVLHRDDRL